MANNLPETNKSVNINGIAIHKPRRSIFGYFSPSTGHVSLWMQFFNHSTFPSKYSFLKKNSIIMNALSIVISPQNLLNKPYTEMVTLNGGFCEEEALAQKMQA